MSYPNRLAAGAVFLTATVIVSLLWGLWSTERGPTGDPQWAEGQYLYTFGVFKWIMVGVSPHGSLASDSDLPTFVLTLLATLATVYGAHRAALWLRPSPHVRPVEGGEVGGPRPVPPAMDDRQMEALRDALCSAFDPHSLDQMLRLRLGKDRAVIVSEGGFQVMTFNLIRIALREGWHRDLIRAACEAVPRNPALRQFCRDYPELAPRRDGSQGEE